MLKTPVIHPTIMEVLARSGHFAQVVIADGNLPVGAMNGPNSTTVHLNFKPGLLDALTVLEGILEVCPIQGAIVMEKPSEANAEIHLAYKELLGDVSWSEMERWAFYDQIRDKTTTLIIQTGEQRRFANLILTVGVVKMAEESSF
ncbi:MULTISPECIES: RbsD/FucU domain-containing protein [Maribacter]|uniref:L-fucose mutarotase n=1 Tax=Maribacter dokdonensis TaxID=320912 RepID=A0A1H4T854_9FLAO|nr:RbsD/FucU family protein [Maribacter dokdonensis]MDP2524719.1 RbsD/FucU family protein [Maribacter dokdonensis]CAG2531505.1 L-fucose mutarotase [Maribacter dokdonensis]SEC52450.1 L-fucose mutarotase [Maribacter dokdonensis]|tara:strand:- start:7519 stop:7953 length:435 start_codon:yes stop_codon:yes gene_type:complete